MPLIKPEIQEALRTIGLNKKSNESISEKLEANSLSLDDALSILSDLAHGSSNEQLILRAVETSLKLHGVLKEQSPQAPVVNIVINDPKGSSSENPILLPRELLKEQVQ